MAARRKTNEEFIELCKKREDFNEYKLLDEYEKSNKKIKIKHKTCGNIFEMTPHNFYYNKEKCPYCFKGSNIRRNSFLEVKIFIEKDNKYELLSKKYDNTSTKLKIRCKKCDSVFLMNYRDFKRGYGCPSCAGNKKLSYDELSSKIKNIDSEYKMIKNAKDRDNYKNVHSKIKIKHLSCGRTFKKSYNNFRNGQRCIYCSLEKGESFAVKNIKEFLDKNHIKYKSEITFKDLINPKTNKKLRIDFYLEDLNLYLEYDGKQHFCYSEKGLYTYDKYLELKERDEIKNKYFKENNLNLIRINYKEDEIKILKDIIFNDYPYEK